MTRVLYPGSFDPVTKGHMNIIEQAAGLFDEVVIAVMHNPLKKTSFFAADERLDMIQELYGRMNNIKAVSASGTAADAAALHGCRAIIRGLRSLSDYDYEVQLHQINNDISEGSVSTVCLFADSEYQFVSSSVVIELFSLGKDIAKYAAPLVRERMLIKKGLS